MLKLSKVKLLGSVLIVVVIIESVSGIIGKTKGKRKKHKDDDDDYEDDDPTCYPGRNCVPGCYCSGEYCRPYFPPKNKAEAKLKCKTFHYPQWSLSKKKKGHKHKNKHKHDDLNAADIAVHQAIESPVSEIGDMSRTKSNFTTKIDALGQTGLNLSPTLAQTTITPKTSTKSTDSLGKPSITSTPIADTVPSFFVAKPVHPKMRALHLSKEGFKD